jgi:hypothetical protein
MMPEYCAMTSRKGGRVSKKKTSRRTQTATTPKSDIQRATHVNRSRAHASSVTKRRQARRDAK